MIFYPYQKHVFSEVCDIHLCMAKSGLPVLHRDLTCGCKAVGSAVRICCGEPLLVAVHSRCRIASDRAVELMAATLSCTLQGGV